MLGRGLTEIVLAMAALVAGVQACGEAREDDGRDDAQLVVSDASAATDASPPPPAATPFVWGAGLGVTDLAASTAFFVDFLDLEVESRADFADRQEVVLWAKNQRGFHLTLTKFADGRSTRDIPAKLLFVVKNTEDLYARLLKAGYASNFPTVPVAGVTEAVAQIKGPEGYAIELSQYATDASFLIALGFTVGDATASESFYKTALGMARTSQYPLGGTTFGAIELPDEFVVNYTGGSKPSAAIVLMSYRSRAFNAKDNPVKSVHHVPDVAATVARAIAAGATLAAPVSSPAGAKRTAALRDPDGYLVELVEQ